MAKQSPSAEPSISSVLSEERLFEPPAGFGERAARPSAKDLARLRKQAAANPVAYWEQQAERITWRKRWRTALTWKHPHAKWFVGGTLNAAENCLDRHLDSWVRTKAAIIWEGEDGSQRTLTYHQLHAEVCRCANALTDLGVQPGDVVAIYMGMVPEAAIAMLACARIGATHTVVFGGFSSDALRDRINDSNAVCLITQDVAFRRGAEVDLYSAAATALKKTPTVRNVLVVQRSPLSRRLKTGRDVWWHQAVSSQATTHVAKAFDAEHPLFILYTSGSTGKPKGIRHTTGGYMVHVATTMDLVFDVSPRDVYFCTADVGWITGHSYIVYGPFSQGATVLMYEGAPNYPGPDRFWDIVARHRVSIFYTAPTAIRAFMKWGEQWPKRHDLSSLRLLGTVGEPINPEAWMWYHRVIGQGRCPIVDTWWQTETGGIMIAPIPGLTPTKPGTATMPLPGVVVDVVRKDGTTCKPNEGGLLVVKHPWPGMLRTVHGDDERYKKTYWSEFPKTRDRDGWYFTGDGARRDADGYIWIMGRVDDVVNVSGHRLGTAEVESALVSHPRVAEAAVVARPDEVKGNALVAFVTLKSGGDVDDMEVLRAALRNHVANEIGHIAKPDDVRFAEALPKTRSGKIMRRLLREIVSGGNVSGDTTTLEDFSVLEALRAGEEE
jgi:acetyl-CoA synthetase